MKEFDVAKLREDLVDFKYAHKRGRDSALDDKTREYHRGAFIAIGSILSLMKKERYYMEK